MREETVKRAYDGMMRSMQLCSCGWRCSFEIRGVRMLDGCQESTRSPSTEQRF
jgi:hypothetical protein